MAAILSRSCPLWIKKRTSIEHQARIRRMLIASMSAMGVLVDFDPGCLDDSLPLLGILFQKPREFSCRGTLHGVRVACKLLDDDRIGESFSNITTYFLHDFRWCLGRRKNALPAVSYVARNARFGDGRDIWRCRRSLGAR